MAYLGTTQLDPFIGDLVYLSFPVAGSQTLVEGDLVCLVNGLLTKCAAANADLDSTSNGGVGILGICAQDSASQTAGTLVRVAVFTGNEYLTLPAYTTVPTTALVGAPTSPTSGYIIRNDAGIWKINLGTTANPLLHAFAIEMTDARKTARTLKGTYAAGDRVHAKVIPGARQLG